MAMIAFLRQRWVTNSLFLNHARQLVILPVIFCLQQFNIYIRKYLSSFPELSDKDFPKFSEFDVDESGLVTFQEWQKYIELQKEIEAKKAATGALKSDAYGELLDVLYNDDSLSGAKKNEKGNGVGSHKRYS